MLESVLKTGKIFRLVEPKGVGKDIIIEMIESLRKPASDVIKVLALDSAFSTPARCQSGAASAIRPGLQPGNFLRRLGLPKAIKDWPSCSLQVKLIKIGGRIIGHSRQIVFKLGEVAVSRELFTAILERVSRLRLALSKHTKDAKAAR